MFINNKIDFKTVAYSDSKILKTYRNIRLNLKHPIEQQQQQKKQVKIHIYIRFHLYKMKKQSKL